MKKLLLSLGSIGAVVAPVVAIVACAKKTHVVNMINLNNKDKDGKILNLDILLYANWDVTSNSIESAGDFISQNKNNMSPDVKINVISSLGSKTMTWTEFASTSTPPQELKLADVKENSKKLYQDNAYSEIQKNA